MSRIQDFARIPEEKKLLLMPRNVKENEVLFHLCGEVGATSANLTVTSLIDVAQECYLWQQTMRGNVPKRLAQEQGTLTVMSILQELNAEGQLLFFRAEWIDVPTCEEIFRNLTLCRKYGVMPEQLRRMAAVSEKERAKFADLAKILERYGVLLAAQDDIDEAALYQCVTEAAANGEELPVSVHYDRIGMERGDYEALSLTEREFLKALLRASGIRSELPELLEDDAEDVSAGRADGKASERIFFAGYGVVNEVSYVAEAILRRSGSFDEVTVLCPDESYMTAVAEQFQEWGIPAVCDGISIRHSRSVEILERFYRYVAGGYERGLFVELLYTNGITVPREKDEDIDRSEMEERLQKKLREICPADAKEEREVCRVAADLRDFMTNYTYANGAAQQQIAYRVVLSMLADHEKIKGCVMPFASAVRWLFEKAEALTAAVEFGKKRDRQGEIAKVEVRTLPSIRFLNTDVVFVLGMTAGSFLSSEHDSSVLSDEARQALGIRELEGERSAKKLRRFQYALALHDTEGRKQYFGYNACSLNNLTEQVPCLTYRMLREQSRDGKDDEKEIELYDFLRRQSFGKYFQQKFSAEADESDLEKKAADLIRPQDGKGRTEYSLAATGLHALVVCPMKYYLQCELKLADSGEPFIKPDEWLPSADKGTLVHAVLEQYVNQVYLQEQPIADAGQRAEIADALLEKELSQMREYRPCTDYLYRKEKKLAEKAIASCIRQIEEDGFTPVYTEYAIGKVAAREHHDADVVEIPVSGRAGVVGKICMSGVIDRIDRRSVEAQDGSGKMLEEYRIVDYKTGKKAKTTKPFDFIVQDYLYVRAWQKILERKELPGKIASAVYEYIYLEKADGHERLARSSADWENAENFIADVLERIRQEGFISYRKLWEQDENMLKAAEAIDAVGYCPYAGFCPVAEKEHCGKGATRKW